MAALRVIEPQIHWLTIWKLSLSVSRLYYRWMLTSFGKNSIKQWLIQKIEIVESFFILKNKVKTKVRIMNKPMFVLKIYVSILISPSGKTAMACQPSTSHPSRIKQDMKDKRVWRERGASQPANSAWKNFFNPLSPFCVTPCSLTHVSQIRK